MKSKILYLITDLNVGGAEEFLLLTLKNINRQKFHPYVCCLYGGKLEREIENLGVKVINLKMKNKFDIFVLFKLYSLLRKEKFNIVHTHLFHANIIGRVIARLVNVPIVVSTQHYAFSYNGRLGMFLEKVTAPLTDRIIVVSEAARKFCINQEGIPAEKLQLIYNGIDINMKDMPDDVEELKTYLSLNNNFVIGCVGRFVEVKGHQYLLKAIKEVTDIYPKIKLLLVGRGSLKEKLTAFASELGIAKLVIFLDERRNVAQILNLLDLCVLPSLQEGLSITLLEALAMGRPCIATAVGGNREVIVDGESGILVRPRDDKALAEAIISLLNDRQKASALGSNGRLRVKEHFNIKQSVTGTQSLYELLVEKCEKR